MKIEQAPHPENTCPKTRHELLRHLWAAGYGTANVFREGAWYALVCGGVVSATHIKRIGSWTFSEWESQCKFTASLRGKL